MQCRTEVCLALLSLLSLCSCLPRHVCWMNGIRVQCQQYSIASSVQFSVARASCASRVCCKRALILLCMRCYEALPLSLLHKMMLLKRAEHCAYVFVYMRACLRACLCVWVWCVRACACVCVCAHACVVCSFECD